ncbi:hypothetical protein GCM10020331_019530 [Ectobacillus funiculus]
MVVLAMRGVGSFFVGIWNGAVDTVKRLVFKEKLAPPLGEDRDVVTLTLCLLKLPAMSNGF